VVGIETYSSKNTNTTKDGENRASFSTMSE
jgi:hypothetical protein